MLENHQLESLCLAVFYLKITLKILQLPSMTEVI